VLYEYCSVMVLVLLCFVWLTSTHVSLSYIIHTHKRTSIIGTILCTI